MKERTAVKVFELLLPPGEWFDGLGPKKQPVADKLAV